MNGATMISGPKQWPVLLLGTAQLGLPYGVVRKESPADDAEAAFAILRAAQEEGFSGVDTAMAYRNAPKRIGSFLERSTNAVDSWIICTKLMKEQPSTPVSLRNSWDGHLRELRSESVFALLLHRADDVLDDDVRTFCRTMKNESRTRHLGASVYSPEEARRAIENGFGDVLEIPLNAFSFPRWERPSGAFGASFIVARSVFLQGVLLCDAVSLPESVKHLSEHVLRFRSVCSSHGFSPLEGAFAVVGSFPWVSAVTVGVDTVAQLRKLAEAYRSVRGKMQSPAELSAFLDDLRAIAEMIPENSIDPRFWS